MRIGPERGGAIPLPAGCMRLWEPRRGSSPRHSSRLRAWGPPLRRPPQGSADGSRTSCSPLSAGPPPLRSCRLLMAASSLTVGYCFFLAFTASLLGALVELFSNRLDDNLMVPIASALVAMLLL